MLRAVSRVLLRWPVLAPLIGVLLALPAVGSERVLDDHVLELAARRSSSAITHGAGVDLFRFASGKAGDNLALMAEGSLLPWWSDPELKISFYRPLSSLLHRLDYAAWPAHPELMYVHSLIWFAVLLVLIVRLYAAFETSRVVATLATWLYALNDAHGTDVAWLSNRNALISAVGALAALLAHRRARRDGHAPSRVLAPLWLAFSLFAGELGASTWGYLIAYALVFEAGSLWRRLSSLASFALVTLGWLAMYLESGAGTHASGVYLHPLGDLPTFAAELPRRASLLVGAALGPIPAELSFLGPAALRPAWLIVALLWAGAFVWIARRELSDDPVARFWCIGAALGVVPVAASFPSDRLLILVNVGAMALVARLLAALWGRFLSEQRLGGFAGACSGTFGVLLCAVHGLLAPLLLPQRAHQVQELGRAMGHAFAVLDAVENLDQKTLIVLGAPADFFVSYLQVERAARDVPRPEHVYWLTNPEARLELRVRGDRTLSLTREGGFFVSPAESLYRRRSAALAVNAEVSLPELTARVSGLDASGASSRVELSFDAPLTHPRFVYLALRGRAYERVAPEHLDHLRLEPAWPLSDLMASAPEN